MLHQLIFRTTMSNKNYLTDLLRTEDEQLKKLHHLISDSLHKDETISQKIHQHKSKPTLGQRLADKIASFGGSWKFIIIFTSILFIWIGINSYLFFTHPFDPYPFILLNLLLSCIAALQAPIIMMSQNRQEQKDRKRAEDDYVINLKAEIEIRDLHQKVDLLMTEQMKVLVDIQKVQIQLIEKIDKKLKKYFKKIKKEKIENNNKEKEV